MNSDYTENVSRNSKTTTFVSATVGSNASGSGTEATAPTIKPHRSKAEILTEIVSDYLNRFACDFVKQKTKYNYRLCHQPIIFKIKCSLSNKNFFSFGFFFFLCCLFFHPLLGRRCFRYERT